VRGLLENHLRLWSWIVLPY